jgi:hypothetical protein
MNQLGILDLFLSLITFLCLLIGLFFRWHKNHALFLFSCLIVISNILNPFLFMANENMYVYTGWSAVRSFNFTIEALIHSYNSSNLIYSLIILFSLPFLILMNKKDFTVFTPTQPAVLLSNKLSKQAQEKKYENRLIFLCISLMCLYYPLYNNGIGVTGLPGELPFHLSGVIHYIRAYLVPFVLVIMLTKTDGSKRVIFVLLLYAIMAGISASSRFVGLLPIVLLMIYFIKLKKYSMFAFYFLYALFLWLMITTSRDLTFDGNSHNLLEVVYYSLTNISFDDIVSTLDVITGRLSSAQQIVLAHQFRGYDSCSHLYSFLFGFGDICTDTAGVVYGLDLSGTSYGTGLSLIPSIIISSDSYIDYILPSILICGLIWISQFFYQKLNFGLGWHGIASLYLFLSILFIFLGQMLFFYYLQYLVVFAIFGYLLWKRLCRI